MDHRRYVPVLKWKMGEYQALSRLTDVAKKRVTPLIEILPPDFDFETRQAKKSHEDHLKDFGKRLYSKWDGRECLLDLRYLEKDLRINHEHPVDFIFRQTSENSCRAVPVVSFSSDPEFLRAVSRVSEIADLGIAVRLAGSDFDHPQFESNIKRIGAETGVGWGKTDVIIDLRTPEYIPRAAFRNVLSTLIGLVPQVNRSRSLIVVGTSYPEVLSAYKNDEFIPREEWLGYKDYVSHLGEGARIPTFGDYAVAHPSPVQLDMRMITPLAKLRYTLEDKWYLAFGKSVRSEGFDQYRDMCKRLIRREFYDGPDFSAGDRYIYDCAHGDAKTGNLSTWVWVANNRHISRTAVDLSNFYGL